jgi:hypothetical protein
LVRRAAIHINAAESFDSSCLVGIHIHANEKGAVMTEPRMSHNSCCAPQCDRTAVFLIQGTGAPHGYAKACSEHVEDLATKGEVSVHLLTQAGLPGRRVVFPDLNTWKGSDVVPFASLVRRDLEDE